VSTPADPRSLRCSDADRDAVAEHLRRAAGEGRLLLEELDERLERAYAARTYGDLDAVLADLPLVTGPSSMLATLEVLKLTAPVNDRKQAGRWIVPPRIVAEAGLGTVKIDFTEAACSHAVVRVEAKAWAGSVVLVVPPGWAARTDEVTSGAGSVRNKVPAQGGSSGPLLHVTGHAALGDVIVRHPRPRRWLPR
jgi:Domain of unknown function (DUF1707)